MESLSFDPNHSHRNDVGGVVRTWAPVQTIHGVYASTDNGAGHHQRQNAARLEGSLHIVLRDNREIIISSSDLKLVSGLSGAVCWMNPMLPKPGAQRMATYQDTSTPIADSSYPGQNMTNARNQMDYNASVFVPDPAIDSAEIEHFGGHAENDWPSQNKIASTARPILQAGFSSPQNWKETVPRSLVASPMIDSSSWNGMQPNSTVQPFSTDQYLNVEQHDYQHGSNPFNDANTSRYSDIPRIRVNQASDNALAHAKTFDPSTLYDSAGPHRPEFPSVRPDRVTQTLHPGGNHSQANLELQQGDFPRCHDMDYFEPSYDPLSRQEVPTPEIAIGSGAGYPCQEPAMPNEQQVTVGLPYAPRQIHPDEVQLESKPMEEPRRGLKAPQSAAHTGIKPGRPRGGRTGPLTAAQKNRASIVRRAGPKSCNCSRRKVGCNHVAAESLQSPGAQRSGTFLAATGAQNETTIYGEPDTPSSQSTSWLTETTALSPSRNQSFGNIADLDMSRMNLFTADYQPVINVDDAKGDMDDEEMLEMGVTPLQ